MFLRILISRVSCNLDLPVDTCISMFLTHILTCLFLFLTFNATLAFCLYNSSDFCQYFGRSFLPYEDTNLQQTSPVIVVQNKEQ